MENQKNNPSPEWIKGYHAGLHQGYNIALEDFKAGLRSIWKKDENGNYKIVEKFHYVDKDEAEMSRAKFGAGKKLISLSPEQLTKFNTRVTELVSDYFKSNPHMIGKIHPHAFLIAPGAVTNNWGEITSFKILVLLQPFGIRDHIPESQIISFIDYEP